CKEQGVNATCSIFTAGKASSQIHNLVPSATGAAAPVASLPRQAQALEGAHHALETWRKQRTLALLQSKTTSVGEQATGACIGTPPPAALCLEAAPPPLRYSLIRQSSYSALH